MWNDSFELLDFHSHIIPNIDDGAPDVETSVKMLSMLVCQGIDKVIATSHYHGTRESISSFVKRRDLAMSHLLEEINKNDICLPKIIPAAEVRIYPGMHAEEDLSKLCVANSNKILVEMPYTAWSDWMYEEVYSLKAKGYCPIIAHVERYVDLVGEKEIEQKLLSLGVLVQINADFLLSRKEKKFVKSLIKKDKVTVIGSDCHNTTSRKPNLSKAFSYIIKKYGEAYLARLMANANAIIDALQD